jgi:hypothetical protein
MSQYMLSCLNISSASSPRAASARRRRSANSSSVKCKGIAVTVFFVSESPIFKRHPHPESGGPQRPS